jgi:hypothetical protein
MVPREGAVHRKADINSTCSPAILTVVFTQHLEVVSSHTSLIRDGSSVFTCAATADFAKSNGGWAVSV